MLVTPTVSIKNRQLDKPKYYGGDIDSFVYS